MSPLLFLVFVTVGLPFVLLSFWLFVRWIHPKKMQLEAFEGGSPWSVWRKKVCWTPLEPVPHHMAQEKPKDEVQESPKESKEGAVPPDAVNASAPAIDALIEPKVIESPTVRELLKEIGQDVKYGVLNATLRGLWHAKRSMSYLYEKLLYSLYWVYVIYWVYPIRKEANRVAKSSYVNSLIVCFSLLIFGSAMLPPVMKKSEVPSKEQLQMLEVKYVRQQAVKNEQGYVLWGKTEDGQLQSWRCSSSVSSACFGFKQERVLQGKSIELLVFNGLVFEVQLNGEVFENFSYENFVKKWTISFWQWLSYALALYCALYSILGTVLRYQSIAKQEMFAPLVEPDVKEKMREKETKNTLKQKAI